MTEPIRVFIGTDHSQNVPTAVLRHSILSRTASPVEFHELKDLQTGLEEHFYTGFSFYRWGIPLSCGFKGRALYLDADIVVLGDIRELWEHPLGEHSHLCRRRPRFRFRRFRVKRLGGAYASVMSIECGKCQHWDFRAWCERAEKNPGFYKQVMWCMLGSPSAEGRGDLPPAFNDLDHFEAGRTKIIHYTNLPIQPWKKTGHRYEAVFRQALREAYQAGAVDLSTVEADVTAGHVHPQMIDWCTQDFAAV